MHLMTSCFSLMSAGISSDSSTKFMTLRILYLMSAGISSYSSSNIMTPCVSVWCLLEYRLTNNIMTQFCSILRQVAFCLACFVTNIIILCVSVWCQLACRRIPQRLLWHCVHLSHAQLHKPSLSSTPTPTGGTDARARAHTHIRPGARYCAFAKEKHSTTWE